MNTMVSTVEQLLDTLRYNARLTFAFLNKLVREGNKLKFQLDSVTDSLLRDKIDSELRFLDNMYIHYLCENSDITMKLHFISLLKVSELVEIYDNQEKMLTEIDRLTDLGFNKFNFLRKCIKSRKKLDDTLLGRVRNTTNSCVCIEGYYKKFMIYVDELDNIIKEGDI